MSVSRLLSKLDTHMTKTQIEVVGTYKIDAPPEAFEDALAVQGDEDYVSRELSSIALVELKVLGADHRFDLTRFKQPHTEYVPYDETFLDIEHGTKLDYDGSHLGFGVFDDFGTMRTLKYTQATERTEDATVEEAEQYRLPGRRNFAVVFFLHFFDCAHPLETPYGPIRLPSVGALPERLSWKKYVY